MSQLAPWLEPVVPQTLDVNQDNIPHELKQKKRWLVWKAVLKENGKITKPPFRATNPSLGASTNNPAHLSDFETAFEAYKQFEDVSGIGFVAEPGAGLVFIDMDDCVVDGEADDDAFSAVNAFASYTEKSPSGNGIRIIARGGISHDFTNKPLGREMYGGGGTRYLTITGQVIEGLNTIEDAQEALSHYHHQWDTRKQIKPEHKAEVIGNVQSVDLSKLSEATVSLIHGKTVSSYESRSEAVLGVAKDMHRSGYSDSDIAHVLTNPEYAISEKALENRRGDIESAKQWVAEYTIPRAKTEVANEPQTVSFTMNNGSINETFPEPEPAPVKDFDTTDLHNPPGLVGEIAKAILDNAIRPQPMFAVSGALAAVSIASQNYYRCAYMGGSINLYQTQVGGTASGKDGPRKAIKKIFSEIGMANLVPESVASGPALLRSLANNQVLGFMPDEFGLLLQTALNDRGSVHLKDMVSEMMRLYSLGDSIHTGKRYADADNNIPEIRRPFVNMLGSTTPSELSEALSVAQVDNGFLNRILYVEAEHEKPAKRRGTFPGYSKTLLNRIRGLSAFAGGIPASVRQPETIYFIKAAEDALNDFDDLCDQKHEGEFGAIWNRAHENTIRVAGVIAVGIGGQPNVTLEIAQWAINFVTWCTHNMIRHLEENLSGSQFESDAKKALKIISNPDKYANDKKYGEYCRAGVMPRAKILKLMKCKGRYLEELIDYLIETEQVEKGEDQDSKKQRPVTVYRVKR